MHCYSDHKDHSTIPIRPLLQAHFPNWLSKQSAAVRHWMEQHQFTAKPASTCHILNADGSLREVYVGMDDPQNFWCAGDLPKTLAKGHYYIDPLDDMPISKQQLDQLQLAWGLGHYQFTRYRKADPFLTTLFLPTDKQTHFSNLLNAFYLAQDLINTPADDLGPADLAAAVTAMAKPFHAKVQIIKGEKLLKQQYNAIYTVGRASDREPHLIDLRWGDADKPAITLVGKGICFDSGGLDIKPSSGMRHMKKDMGGAAHALALAHWIMAEQLPVRLRLLIPAADNSVGQRSFHPGDVITTKAGITVEISNTDAEGRLVLCDALTEAMTEKPACLLDFATLTGAARVALGPDLPAFFCNNATMAQNVVAAATAAFDPIWHLPLHQPYKDYLKSPIADCMNAAETRFAGAITAALYLQQFVSDEVAWGHFDLYGWNDSERPGRTVGGMVQTLRGVFNFIKDNYAEPSTA